MFLVDLTLPIVGFMGGGRAKPLPRKRQYRILLDGEAVLRAEVAETTMAEKKIKLLGGWSKYSHDLNPQENVWPAAEEAIRAAEKNSDTFADFQKRCVKATRYIRNRSLMFRAVNT